MPRGVKFIPETKQAELVENLAGYGLTVEEIACTLKLAPKTIALHYAEAMQMGRAKAKAAIAGALIRKAIKGDTTCMIFYLKTQCGWREREAALAEDDRTINISINTRAEPTA